MTGVKSTLVKHGKRLNEIASVVVRHGLASVVERGESIAGLKPVEKLVHRVTSTDEADATDRERRRDAFTELGTTFIKFAQMLGLRPMSSARRSLTSSPNWKPTSRPTRQT
jgi:predicted unusual protein kinase regulating ubiquinone biosynthesis (AarF/ABC1/UbiB family)